MPFSEAYGGATDPDAQIDSQKSPYKQLNLKERFMKAIDVIVNEIRAGLAAAPTVTLSFGNNHRDAESNHAPSEETTSEIFDSGRPRRRDGKARRTDIANFL